MAGDRAGQFCFAPVVRYLGDTAPGIPRWPRRGSLQYCVHKLIVQYSNPSSIHAQHHYEGTYGVHPYITSRSFLHTGLESQPQTSGRLIKESLTNIRTCLDGMWRSGRTWTSAFWSREPGSPQATSCPLPAIFRAFAHAGFAVAKALVTS